VSQSTDADLIASALGGDRAAFGDLVRRYQDRLYHSMFHICGTAEDAQDIVQDAFVHAFVKLQTFQRQSAFYTWLYRIALNQHLSQRRRRPPPLSLDQQRQFGGDPVDGQARPTAPLEQRDRIARVHAALLELSQEYRQVLVLREMEGWSYETIAEVLDLPIGTVRSRLHRARSELRALLQDVYEEELK
jgi:RNA polymerase sigma-70 factor (ECF subfamily)